MAISYNKLWKLLIDRKMSKADLRRAAGIAPNTMTKLNHDKEVTLETLWTYSPNSKQIRYDPKACKQA